MMKISFQVVQATLVCAGILILSGCDSGNQSSNKTQTLSKTGSNAKSNQAGENLKGEVGKEPPPKELLAIRILASKLLKVPVSKIQDDVPLSDHQPPMGELHLLELVIEIEEQFAIKIPDAALEAESDNKDPTILKPKITLRAIAKVVEKIRSKKPENQKK